MVIIKAVEDKNIIEYTNDEEDTKNIVIVPKNIKYSDFDGILGEKFTLDELLNKLLTKIEEVDELKYELKEKYRIIDQLTFDGEKI